MNRGSLIESLKELREKEFEADAGDGFQRASDEQIERIADLVMKLRRSDTAARWQSTYHA